MSTQSAETERASLQSQAADGIVAELELEHDNLILGSTLRTCRDGRVELEYWSDLEDGRTMLFFTAESVPFDAFEATLERDVTVTNPVLVERYPRRRVYRATLTDRAVRFTSQIAEAGGRILEVTSGHAGWVARLRFPSREDLVAFNRACERRNITFKVNHLRLAEPNETAVVGLTRKQEELLSVAHEEGYFDVPRGISQDELADRLGVSKSAVSQRLRRAMNELCETSL